VRAWQVVRALGPRWRRPWTRAAHAVRVLSRGWGVGEAAGAARVLGDAGAVVTVSARRAPCTRESSVAPPPGWRAVLACARRRGGTVARLVAQSLLCLCPSRVGASKPLGAGSCGL